MPTAVSFGFPIEVNRAHKDWVALWLVRSFLGEHRNSNSFLYQKIREARGMNYGDYAYIEYFPNGMYRTQPSANLGRSEQIFQVWLRPLRSNTDAHFATRTAMYEIEKLIADGMTEEQFEATRAFLSKYAGLLLKGQDRVLGYQMDSDFYGTKPFIDVVKKGLKKLTLKDVNKVIRKHLQLDDIQFVFITADGADMKARLVNETPSPMTYNAEKPAELLAEDQIIQDYKTEFACRASGGCGHRICVQISRHIQPIKKTGFSAGFFYGWFWLKTPSASSSNTSKSLAKNKVPW